MGGRDCCAKSSEGNSKSVGCAVVHQLKIMSCLKSILIAVPNNKYSRLLREQQSEKPFLCEVKDKSENLGSEKRGVNGD